MGLWLLTRQSTLPDIVHINIMMGKTWMEKRRGERVWDKNETVLCWPLFKQVKWKPLLIRKMYHIGKVTQMLMKISPVYLLIKHFNSTIWKETFCLPGAILPYFKKAEIYVFWVLISYYIQQLCDTLEDKHPTGLTFRTAIFYYFNSGTSTDTDCSLMLLSWTSHAGRETLLICEIRQYIKSVLVFKPQ